MEDRYDIGVDIGEDDSKCVATLFDGVEYRPIAVCDSINFGDSVQRSGYVGVEAGELSFSADISEVSDDFLHMLSGIECPKRFEDDFERFASEVASGLSRVMMGVDEEYTTPRCDMVIDASDKSEYYPNVSATFRRK